MFEKLGQSKYVLSVASTASACSFPDPKTNSDISKGVSSLLGMNRYVNLEMSVCHSENARNPGVFMANGS